MKKTFNVDSIYIGEKSEGENNKQNNHFTSINPLTSKPA